MTELDLTDGKIFLNKVTEKIRTRLAEVDASIEAGQKDIQSMNEYYWENYTEMDEYGYENYDNQQALLHQVNDNQEKLKMQHRLRKMLEAPFSDVWILSMMAKTNRRYSISASVTLRNVRVCCL